MIPKMPFTREELAILDGPAASPFVSALYITVWRWFDNVAHCFLVADYGISWRDLVIPIHGT